MRMEQILSVRPTLNLMRGKRGSVAPSHSRVELTLVDHLHQFDAHENSSRVIELLGAKHRLHSRFNSAVVLLHDVTQVLTAANLLRVFPHKVKFIAHSHAP